jgi:hypothetical protein
MATFEQDLYNYVETLVPYWRVCDEAWPLGEDNLVGIGVLRNYGGQVMVLPWNQNTSDQLRRLREQLEPFLKHIIVVVPDCESEELEAIDASVAPVEILLWSRRTDLANFVIKDSPD